MTHIESLGTIGSIGLGDMGYGIAMNIAKQIGHDTVAFDLRPELEADVLDWGGRWPSSSAQLLAESDIVTICLLDDKQVRAFVEDERLFETMRPDTTLVFFSTIDPSLMHELQAQGDECGITVLGAPVSGAYPASMAGTLTVMVGGDHDQFERLRPLWAAMGKEIYWLGADTGAGQVAKLCNNMICLTINLITVEAVHFARAFGIAEETLLEVVRASSGNSWMVENWGVMDRLLLTHPKGGPDAGHMIALKDIYGAISAAESSGTDVAVAKVVVAQGEKTLANRYAVLKERESSSAAPVG